MRLSIFQKSIVESIRIGKVKDIDSFLNEFCEFDPSTNKENFISFYNFRAGIKVFIPKDEDKTLSHIKEFISLWNKLERAGLINTVPESPGKKLPPVFTRVPNQDKIEPNNKILFILNNYFQREIIPYLELEDFIKQNYLTYEEYHMLEEKLDREKSFSLTRKIAYVTIGLSTLITIGTTIFNYLTYTTDRNVKIKNYPDTTKVILVNPEQIYLSDSLSINQSAVKDTLDNKPVKHEKVERKNQ